jgi:ABC-type transporter Mla subunit MlaD
MSGRYEKSGDPLTKGLSIAVALGALAFGAAAAMLNSERTRQLRQDLERQIDDLSNRLERALAERRPDIEEAIQRSRQAAVDGLDKVKGAVEQSADKAQEYVYRASSKAASTTAGTAEQTQQVMLEAGEPIEAGTSEAATPDSGATNGGSDSPGSHPS